MYYIGIDLGGTNIAMALVDEDCKIVARAKVPTNAARTDVEIVDDMGKLAKQIIADNNLTEADIYSIGIGLPGTMDRETGVSIYANNLPFRGTPIRQIMNKYVNTKVFIENDANCAALGEAYAGAAKGVEHSLMLTLGTGLGGGIIINKKIYCGFNGAGGEIGHKVIVVDGRPCTCGRNGCFESYCSATALVKLTKEAMEQDKASQMWQLCEGDINKAGGKTSFTAARQSDKTAQGVVDLYIKYLASGITDLINVFQPQVISIGGGVSGEGDNLLAPLVKQVQSEQYTKNIEQTTLCIAKLGNDAGIIGAAMLGKAR